AGAVGGHGAADAGPLAIAEELVAAHRARLRRRVRCYATGAHIVGAVLAVVGDVGVVVDRLGLPSAVALHRLALAPGLRGERGAIGDGRGAAFAGDARAVHARVIGIRAVHRSIALGVHPAAHAAARAPSTVRDQLAIHGRDQLAANRATDEHEPQGDK